MFKRFAILYQIDIINKLSINLPDKYVRNCRSSRNRLRFKYYSYQINFFFKESNDILINQLHLLINDNYIDVCMLKEHGFYRTIRKSCVDYNPSCTYFEMYLLRNKEIRDKTINNLLHAILLLDYANSIDFRNKHS